jgi:L-serine/L-threonine ammonia-lyase
MITKLRVAGAHDIIQYGASWVEADTYLRETVLVEARKRGERPVYVSPFDDPAIWAGHATLVDEIVEDLSSDEAGMESVKAFVCSVGGGGLFCGVVQGLEKHKLEQKVKVVALETEGADSLYQSVHAGKHITLDKITSIATSLGARKVADKTYEYATRDGNNVICERLSDREAIMGCLELAEWERVLVEPACGINVAVCMNDRLAKLIPDLKQEDKVIVVVCGGSNVNIDMMAKWKSEYMTAST